MTEHGLIDTDELRGQLEEGAITLIDVRLGEDFKAGRIPGAAHNCVFEVSFTDRTGKLCADASAPICVYGAGADSHEARMAAEKLVRAGFENVREFREGLAGWVSAGHPTECEAPPPEPPPFPDGERTVNLDESRIEWLGRNLLNKHWGRIALKSGTLTFADGKLTGGDCVIDMDTITCDDLAESSLHDVLVNHLKSHDFFDVAHYPEGRLHLVEAAPIEDATPGAPNYLIQADLTLKNVSAMIEFPVTAGLTPEGKAAAQAAFSIDRTRWNVLYGSGKFFTRLAGHLVNDEIDLQLKIVTD